MKRKLKFSKNLAKVLSGAFILLFFVGLIMFIKDRSDVIYTEQTKVTYGITMNDETIYNEEDVDILSNDVSKIIVNIEYSNSNKFIDEQAITITSKTSIYVNSPSNQGVLSVLDSGEKNKVNHKVVANSTNISYVIDYKEKVNEVNNFISSQKLEDKIENAIIELSLTSGEERTIVNISLLKKNLSIDVVEEIDRVVKKSNNFNALVMGGALFMFVVCVGFIIYLKKFENMSEYEQKKYKIFKFNKEVLVEGNISNIDANNLIEVFSFKELLKIQNCVNLPIVYSIKDNECIFIVKLSNNGYIYKLEK